MPAVLAKNINFFIYVHIVQERHCIPNELLPAAGAWPSL